jgi:hypothetical protein
MVLLQAAHFLPIEHSVHKELSHRIKSKYSKVFWVVVPSVLEADTNIKLINPEDGGRMFHQNTGIHPQNYIVTDQKSTI